MLPSCKTICETKLDKKIIEERKKTYGNSFPKMAEELRQKYPKIAHEIDIKFAITVMVCLKKARIDFIIEEKDELQSWTDEWMLLDKELEENYTDYANYSWILDNYDQYLLM